MDDLDLTLKAPITTTADDIHKEKIRLDVSSEHEKSSLIFFRR